MLPTVSITEISPAANAVSRPGSAVGSSPRVSISSALSKVPIEPVSDRKVMLSASILVKASSIASRIEPCDSRSISPSSENIVPTDIVPLVSSRKIESRARAVRRPSSLRFTRTRSVAETPMPPCPASTTALAAVMFTAVAARPLVTPLEARTRTSPVAVSSPSSIAPSARTLVTSTSAPRKISPPAVADNAPPIARSMSSRSCTCTAFSSTNWSRIISSPVPLERLIATGSPFSSCCVSVI